jgi:hypothetical protein
MDFGYPHLGQSAQDWFLERSAAEAENIRRDALSSIRAYQRRVFQERTPLFNPAFEIAKQHIREMTAGELHEMHCAGNRMACEIFSFLYHRHDPTKQAIETVKSEYFQSIGTGQTFTDGSDIEF